MAGFVIGRALFGKKETPEASVVDSAVNVAPSVALGGDIQQFLQRILDQTTKLEGLSLEGLAPKALGEVEAQVQKLKADLSAREEELNTLKTVGNPKAAADSEKLSGRIEELEAKLAEYEILEDDIADLSLYKEENTRLRGELERMRGGAPAPAAAPAPESVAVGLAEEADIAASEPIGFKPKVQITEESLAEAMGLDEEADGPGEDIVAEFAQAVQEVVPATGNASPNLQSTGDPLADFAAAVNLEKKMTGEPVAAEAPVPSSPPNLKVVPNLPKEATGEGDDLFAEFAQPPVEEAGSLDTDKMMAEMAALVSMEPSSSALEEDIDTDKMAIEANTLGKAKA